MVKYTSPAKTAISDTRPAESDGKVWVDTSQDPPKMKLYDSATGTFIPAGASETIVSQTEPTPEVGKIWFEPEENRIGVYKGLSAQWQFITDLIPIPASGLARWAFEQTVNDGWGHYDGNDETSAGYSTNSKVGTFAKDFDGSDDYVTIPYDRDLQPVDGPFSVSLWIKTTGQDEYALYFRNSSNNFRGWSVRISGSGDLLFTLSGSNLNQLASNTFVADGNYHHIVCTYSGTDERAIYIDGSLDRNFTSSIGTIDAGGGQPMYIGRQDQNQRHYSGLLDDVRIFSKELSSTEVSNLFNNDSIL